MTQQIGIIDYGTSNLHAVTRCITDLDCQPLVVYNPDQLRLCNRVILPGVGHFGTAVERLHQTGLFMALQKLCAAGEMPVLGICLGMQLLGIGSEESSDAKGIGHFSFVSKRLPVMDSLHYKVPQIGWSSLAPGPGKNSPLLDNLPPESRFYYSHSYAVPVASQAFESAYSCYESPFTAVVRQGRVWGVQFHPEKSYEHGMQLLQNFLTLT